MTAGTMLNVTLEAAPPGQGVVALVVRRSPTPCSARPPRRPESRAAAPGLSPGPPTAGPDRGGGPGRPPPWTAGAPSVTVAWSARGARGPARWEASWGSACRPRVSRMTAPSPAAPASAHQHSALGLRWTWWAGTPNWAGSRPGCALRRAGPGPGRPAVLVIEGEPGIGKTTLWAEATAGPATGLAGPLVPPVPPTPGCPMSGWPTCCAPCPMTPSTRLPAPQRRALRVACCGRRRAAATSSRAPSAPALTALLGGWSPTRPADAGRGRRPVAGPGLGPGPGLRAAAAGDRPVRLVAAVRTEGPRRGGPRVRRDRSRRWTGRRVSACGRPAQRGRDPPDVPRAARRLVPPPGAGRIHRAAGGNPFYALEIAGRCSASGSPPPGQPLPVPGDHRDLALLRLRRLPRATRDVLAARGRDAAAVRRRRGPGRAGARRAGRYRPWCGPAGGSSSPIRCSGRRCTRRCRRRPPEAAPRAGRAGRPARRSGPGIWPWRRTARTRRTAAALDEAPPRRRRTGRGGRGGRADGTGLPADPGGDRQALVRRETRAGRAPLLRRRPDRRAAGA